MEKHLIYVTTGTSHYNFDRMLGLVEQMLNVYPFDVEIILQYGKSNLKAFSNCKSANDFIPRKEAESAYKNADLIFSHCGIGSIFNSLKYNRPTVIIPRYKKYNEFSDDHQLQIAREVSSNKLIYMVEDQGLVVSDFLDFIESNRKLIKKEVDLTNYDLAGFIKSRLYA